MANNTLSYATETRDCYGNLLSIGDYVRHIECKNRVAIILSLDYDWLVGAWAVMLKGSSTEDDDGRKVQTEPNIWCDAIKTKKMTIEEAVLWKLEQD